LDCQRFIWQRETAAGRIKKKKAKVDIAGIPETKKKWKGSQELEDYILLHIGVPMNKRAAAGIAIMIKVKFKKRIVTCL